MIDPVRNKEIADLLTAIYEGSTKWSAQENRMVTLGPGDASRIAAYLHDLGYRRTNAD